MFKFYRSVLAAGVVALGLAACGDDVTVTNPPPPPPGGVTSVTVTPANATVGVGQTITLAASVVADSGVSTALNWVSSNVAIATVSATGVVTGVAPGSTTVIATSVANPARSAAVSITVSGSAFTFAVTPTTLSLATGASFQPSVQIQSGVTATVAWTTSNAAVATVNATTGAITGVAAGTATVTATATSGGQSVSATIGVTVTANAPPGVIAFAIIPPTMTLAPGQSSQATANIQMAPGFTAPTVTWTSLTPAIATVSSTGLITGVSQGSAVVTGSITGGGVTLTGSVAVTVGQGASISISSVTQGASFAGSNCPGVVGAPVVLTNVACQIDVTLNLNAGVQPLDSLVVSIKQGAVFKRAAKQVYGGTIPSAGPVVLSINTANFTKNSAAGTAIVDFFNGPTSMIVQVFPRLGSGGTVVNCQTGAADPTCAGISSMVFNNVDGWAADVTKCSSVIATGVVCPPANPLSIPATGGFATDIGGAPVNAGTTYWGGPTPTGQTTAELYPVFYNDNPAFAPGSALNRCTNVLGNGTGCVTSVTWSIGVPIANILGNTPATVPVAGQWCPPVTQTATPFIQTFGTGAGATNACASYENITAIRDNIIVTTAIDGQNNPFTRVGTLTGVAPIAGPANPNFVLIPNTVVFGATPDSGRFDYKPPAGNAANPTTCAGTPGICVPTVIGAEGFNWVNANFSFTPGGVIVADAGVGPAPASFVVFASANGGSATTFPTQVTTGANLPETNVNCIGAGCDGFTVRATAADRLGNTANSAVSAGFGVDKTAPLLRYSVTTAPSFYAAAYMSGGGAAVLDSTTYFAIQSNYCANVVTPGAMVTCLSAAAGTNDSFRVETIDARSGVSRAVQTLVKFAQTGGSCSTTSPNPTTNGGCTTITSINTPATAFTAPATIDGWLAAIATHVTHGLLAGAPVDVGNSGYFTTTAYVVDKAGNVSGCPSAPLASGNIISGSGLVEAVCAPAVSNGAPPSTVANSNPSLPAGPGATNANLFVRRTLALDNGQPIITGVSPNNSYTGNSSQTWSLGASDDLEVIDARLRIQYPNLTNGNNAGTVPPTTGLVYSYALSSSFYPPNGNNTGPNTTLPTNTGTAYGFFAPIGVRFDNSIINPVVTGIGGTPAMTLDQFTLNVQETCTNALAMPAGAATGPTTAAQCGTATAPSVGDPIPTTGAGSIAITKPNNIGAQVRDVFGSWSFNTAASATTGVSAELVSAILPTTVTAVTSGYSVGYGPVSVCPQGGVVGLGSCVTSGINFRGDGGTGSTRNFRAVQALSVTLPIFTRVDLFGLNAAGEWVFIQRCIVPTPILPNTGPQACGVGGATGTVTGTDNGLERYWVYSFTGIPAVTPVFTAFRALGVNGAGSPTGPGIAVGIGSGLFSSIEP